jgi:predicted esterase
MPAAGWTACPGDARNAGKFAERSGQLIQYLAPRHIIMPEKISSIVLAAGLACGLGCPAFAAVPAKNLPLPGEEFALAGHAAFLIPSNKPANAAAKPWVWYAPTLPGLPGPDEKWLIEQLLAAGIAVAGIDVGESYGSPAGRKLFTALYDEMTATRGYSRRPVLLGRSRGGLMTLSWMADNPDKVGAFAGIYPVCNLTSYPGVSKAADAYAMTPEELQAKLAQHNPIDRLAGLAKAGVPFFAIHGDVDLTVPLDANSGLLKERYTALGGSMEVVVAHGQGHNMWSGFFQCEALVNFVKLHAK